MWLITDKSTSNCAFYSTFCTSERTTLHKVKLKLDLYCNKVSQKVKFLNYVIRNIFLKGSSFTTNYMQKVNI